MHRAPENRRATRIPCDAPDRFMLMQAGTDHERGDGPLRLVLCHLARCECSFLGEDSFTNERDLRFVLVRIVPRLIRHGTSGQRHNRHRSACVLELLNVCSWRSSVIWIASLRVCHSLKSFYNGGNYPVQRRRHLSIPSVSRVKCLNVLNTNGYPIA